VRLPAKVLGRLGLSPLPSSKSSRSILPIARRWRAGDVFCESTPTRVSLLKPAAGQQLQPPNDCHGAYHRQRCEYPEEHSEHALPSLACCRVQQGETSLGPDGVSPKLVASDVPAEQHVEMRVVFPRELLASTGGARLEPGDGLLLQPAVSQRKADKLIR
jgi:hypothetical protein